MSSIPNIELLLTPHEFFRTLLKKASSSLNVSLEEWTEYYLVDLLSRKAPTLPIDRPLALQLKDAVEEEEPRAKFSLYRDLGDSSLLLLGFFRDTLDNRVISRDYVASMGSGAYRVSQSLSRTFDDFQGAYRDLDVRFNDFAYVISTVRRMSAGTLVVPLN